MIKVKDLIERLKELDPETLVGSIIDEEYVMADEITFHQNTLIYEDSDLKNAYWLEFITI